MSGWNESSEIQFAVLDALSINVFEAIEQSNGSSQNGTRTVAYFT